MLGHWVDLDPYFLHRERVLRLIRTERAAEQLARWDPHRALTPSSPAHLATALGLALPALDTAELPRLVYEHGTAVGRLVGIEQTFCFRRSEEGMAATDPRISFEGRLSTDESVTVSGSFSILRIVSASAASSLDGHQHACLIGVVTRRDAARIELNPVFAGLRYFIDGAEDHSYLDNRPLRTPLNQLDRFAAVDFRSPVSDAEMAALQTMPAATVRAGLAAILGTTLTRSGWSRARSSMYQGSLQVRQTARNSMWFFPGTGQDGPLTVPMLGPPGEQLTRLFTCGAGLYIVQHSDVITPEVTSLIAAYAQDAGAWEASESLEYMIIDGPDTVRIFRTHGLLPPI
jgi:hypothetical protein